jgi:hypothetical protein
VLFEDAKPSLQRVFFKDSGLFQLATNHSEAFPHRAMTFDLAEGHTLPFLTELHSPMAPDAVLEASSKHTSPESQTGSSTVAPAQIQKLSFWVYGPRSLSLLYGLSMTSTSREIRE